MLFVITEMMLAIALIDAFSISTGMLLLWFVARIAVLSSTEWTERMVVIVISWMTAIMTIIVPTEKGKTMSECMMFPKNWEKFIEDCSFNDSEEFYTNGSDLVQVFRVEQMVEHYFGSKWIPVSERLPDADGDYLVYKVFYNHGWCEVYGFAKDGRKVNKYDFADGWENVWYDYDSEHGYVTHDSVTHWMPLPEPPQEV